MNVDQIAYQKQVVFEYLKSAFGSASDVQPDKSCNATIDLSFTNGEAVITLMLNLGDVWKPEFHFSLQSVELDKVDILEAKIRDVQEDIQRLRSKECESTTVLFSISSQTVCALSQIVTWNALASKLLTESHFSLSQDYKQVTIQKDGVYQIDIRLAGVNSANGQCMGLQVNGAEIATCHQADGYGYQNTAHIFEILRCKAGDIVQVRCGFNSSSLNSYTSNRFTILYLGK